MQLKDKIFDIMVEENLFGKNFISAINKVSKLLNKNSKIIVDELQKLKEEGSLKFNKKKFINNRQLYKGVYYSSGSNLGYVEID